MKELKSVNRDNNMGTLHLVAALFVMYGHHCALLGQVTPVLFGCAIQAIGVKTIFLISGYLITKSLWNLNGSRGRIFSVYCVKRLGRLYPELLGCVIISAIVIGPIFSSLSWQEYWANGASVVQYIVYNLGMFPIYNLPGVFESNPYPNAVNGSLWTMPVEIMLYFIILIIYLISKKDSVRRIVFAVVTIGMTGVFLIRTYFFPNTSFVAYGTDWIQALNGMPYFLIGGAAWLFKWERYLNLQVSTLFLFIFAGGMTLSTPIINESFCLVFLSCFVLSLMLVPEQKLKLRRIRGEYAYGMYLYGFVVQQCLIKLVLGGRDVSTIGFYVTFVVAVIVTYIVAMISYKIFYIPANKLIQRCLIKLK